MPTPLHIAQVNLMTARAELNSTTMAGFVDLLAPINALADASPGFVWRLQTEQGDSTSVRIYDDDRIMINLSVWETVQALRDFVYASRHIDVIRRRTEWSQRMEGPTAALWWVPVGHRPTPQEARDRLDLLRRHGPSPEAFTFRHIIGDRHTQPDRMTTG